MVVSSRTPEGLPNRCSICGNTVRIEPSNPPGDAPCPNCGSLLWFAESILGTFIDMLVQDAIVPDLRATNSSDAIHEMVTSLVTSGSIDRDHEGDIVQSLLKREELGSTGVGSGVAVPHAVHSSVKCSIGSFAFSHDGIEFKSLDDQHVHVIFLFVSPIDRPDEHLRALERISRYLRLQ